MANVLTQKHKKDLKKEYRLRLSSVALFLLAGAIAAAIVLLLPSFIMARTQQKTLEGEITLLKERVESQLGAEGKDIISVTNAKVAALKQSATQESIEPLFAEIARAVPVGVQVVRIAYDSPGAGELSVSGIAANRQSVLAFTDNLKAVEEFTSVDFPISNLAQDTDIVFSLRVGLVPVVTEEIDEDDGALEDGSS